jgi:hypothetical protein
MAAAMVKPTQNLGVMVKILVLLSLVLVGLMPMDGWMMKTAKQC